VIISTRDQRGKKRRPEATGVKKRPETGKVSMHEKAGPKTRPDSILKIRPHVGV